MTNFLAASRKSYFHAVNAFFGYRSIRKIFMALIYSIYIDIYREKNRKIWDFCPKTGQNSEFDRENGLSASLAEILLFFPLFSQNAKSLQTEWFSEVFAAFSGEKTTPPHDRLLLKL